MADKQKPKKKMGRKPFNPEDRRIRIGVRIAPKTHDFLEKIIPTLGEGGSMGRAIDLCVNVIMDAGIDPTQ